MLYFSIKLDDIIERQSTYPFQKIVDETVIVEPRKRVMHSLNELGSYIWELLKRPQSAQGLINKVTEEYDVDAKEAEVDVTRFLQEMIERDLIKVKN